MISINGRILENVFTTAQWAAITTPLPDRVFGYEIDAGGLPVGKKMGNGIDLWSNLDYWYVGGAASNITAAIPAGTDYTYAYDGRFGDNPTAYVQYDTGSGWQFTSYADVQNNGDILALGDFTTGNWRLVIKP